MKVIAQVVAGLDVSKHGVDACVISGEVVSTMKHGCMDELARDLARRGVGLAVLEPTGGYERPVVAALEEAGIAFAVVNARHIRHFARAAGMLAKTDRLDARVLGEYARRMTPESRPQRDAQRRRLCALVRRRRQLVDMRKAELTRRQQADGQDIVEDIEGCIDFFSTRIKDIEDTIAALIEGDRVNDIRRRLSRGILVQWLIGLLAAYPLLYPLVCDPVILFPVGDARPRKLESLHQFLSANLLLPISLCPALPT